MSGDETHTIRGKQARVRHGRLLTFRGAGFLCAVVCESLKFKTFMANLVRIAALNAKQFFSKLPKNLRAVFSHMSPHAAKTAAEFKALNKATPPASLPVAPKAPKRVLTGGAYGKTTTGAKKPAAAAKAPKVGKAAKAGKKSFLEMNTADAALLEQEQGPHELVEANVVGAPTSTNPLDCDFTKYATPIKDQGQWRQMRA